MKIKLIIIASSILLSYVFTQDSCEDNCGSGTIEEYLNGEIECVCNLECAEYGSACCNFYDICFENPINLTFNDFIGQWNGRIISENFDGHNDSIAIEIFSENTYSVLFNPGSHIVSDNYPGTEDVSYDSVENILSFRWVSYYHYSCGGPCYNTVPFQVMDLSDGSLTLFYNNGSGPAPQANRMLLSLVDWSPPLNDYDLNQDGSVTLSDAIIILTNILNDADLIDADINFDSDVNIFDLIILIDYLNNI